ncbi:hypothetical protein IQ22_00479 [Pseudomonas duriflava]|uniref:Uncharacterized protein n=1 Tax=Pseudomonas duriflava TaxID=459528 RepID=A0A562QPX4_9PSED|nr:hypothetical protein [Pseudomonas duriflava]TWI58767.1 hypothetical protein IQ22_00479 [Pseudomonas duriflava]
MRIDSYTSSYSLDRPGRYRSDNAYAEIQHEEEVRRDRPTDSQAVSQGLGETPLIRRVESASSANDASGSASSDMQWLMVSDQAWYQQPLTARASQALASYGSVALLAREAESQQVMRLDLYV